MLPTLTKPKAQRSESSRCTPYALSIMGQRFLHNCPFGNGNGHLGNDGHLRLAAKRVPQQRHPVEFSRSSLESKLPPVGVAACRITEVRRRPCHFHRRESWHSLRVELPACSLFKGRRQPSGKDCLEQKNCHRSYTYEAIKVAGMKLQCLLFSTARLNRSSGRVSFEKGKHVIASKAWTTEHMKQN